MCQHQACVQSALVMPAHFMPAQRACWVILSDLRSNFTDRCAQSLYILPMCSLFSVTSWRYLFCANVQAFNSGCGQECVCVREACMLLQEPCQVLVHQELHVTPNEALCARNGRPLQLPLPVRHLQVAFLLAQAGEHNQQNALQLALCESHLFHGTVRLAFRVMGITTDHLHRYVRVCRVGNS